MPFGGGGTGSFSLPDHLHTDVVQDGGELERDVTLVDGETLEEYVDSKVGTVPLAFYKATVAESSHNFNFSPAIQFGDFSKLIVIIAGRTNNVSFNLLLQYNAVVTAYLSKRNTVTATVNTPTISSDGTIATTVICGTNQHWAVQAEILFLERDTALIALFQGGNRSVGDSQVGTMSLNGGVPQLDDLLVFTDGNPWAIDTTIAVYGVAL